MRTCGVTLTVQGEKAATESLFTEKYDHTTAPDNSASHTKVSLLQVLASARHERGDWGFAPVGAYKQQ